MAHFGLGGGALGIHSTNTINVTSDVEATGATGSTGFTGGREGWEDREYGANGWQVDEETGDKEIEEEGEEEEEEEEKQTSVPKFFNSILRYSSSPHNICANLSLLHTPESTLVHSLSIRVRRVRNWEFTAPFLQRLFYACKVSRLQTCTNKPCTALATELRAVMPSPTNWPGLDDWAVQLAACMCSQRPYVPCALPTAISTALHDTELQAKISYPSPLPVYYEDGDPTAYTYWAKNIVVAEVLGVVSWLCGMSAGNYQLLREPADHDTQRLEEHGGLLTDLVVAAMGRAAEMGLCPNRVWAIMEGLPEREMNLPALVPPWGRIHVVRHAGHGECTTDFCEQSSVNFTSVTQMHECPLPAGSANSVRCVPTRGLFRPHLLTAPSLAGNPTAWSLDGLRILPPGIRYMAISHVWADGTGTGTWEPGQVNSCLYDFFRGHAAALDCDGLWWDTLCIPQDRAARAVAISNMHENYARAHVTLVHDQYLRSCTWVDAETACFAVLMSPWFTRGWTALELARSSVVKVLFRNNIVKDLDMDILSRAGSPSSLWRQAATAAIVNLRSTRRGITDVNGLLTSLGPRYTSWLRDRAVISGLLAGIKISGDLTQQQIYKHILLKLGTVADGNLFHRSATMSGGFSWCPTSLLSMPPASATSTPLAVQANGDVIGFWAVVAPADGMGTEYDWVGAHPLARVATQFALRHSRRHLCLVERNSAVVTRALLVEVMTHAPDSAQREHGVIRCRFIGPVYFRSLGGNTVAGVVEVTIGETSGMVPLNGETALEYVYRVWEERRERDPGVEGGVKRFAESVGPRGLAYMDVPAGWWGTAVTEREAALIRDGDGWGGGTAYSGRTSGHGY